MEPQATEMRPSAGPAARILAVFALVVAAIIVAVIVVSSVGGSGGAPSRAHGGGAAKAKPNQKYYVVQPGDTFAGIAHKEGISVSKLEELNPNLDTQLLPEKGCVDLVPKGCKVLANGG
jgi:hypothetical protein